MEDQPAVPRDVQLPGQQIEAVDNLEPTIEREPAPDGDLAEHSTAGVASEQRDTVDSDPELGNTLIEPGNS